MNADGTPIPPLPGDPPAPAKGAAMRPPVHQAAPRPLRTRLADRLWRWWRALPLPRRHRHFYQIIGARPVAASTAQIVTGMQGAGSTVLAYRCACHRPEQLRFETVPGRWTVDDLTTPDWPPLISRARAQRLGELATARELLGDGADDVLDPVLPDWRHVAGELAAELQKIPPGILPNSPALAQYRQAVRIQAEADAGQPPAGQTDWAAQPGVMAAKVAGWAAPEGSGSHD